MSIVGVTVTFFASCERNVRFDLALRTCRLAVEHRLRLVVVDASPDERCRTALQAVDEQRRYVRVHRQSVVGRKGAALREGIALAQHVFDDDDDGNGDDGESVRRPRALVFFEPEKCDFVRHVAAVCAPIVRGDADFVNPTRDADAFAASYPCEQVHSERFANEYINTLYARACARRCADDVHSSSSSSSSSPPPPYVDWTFGPVAFENRRWAAWWLAHDGELWTAQMAPLVRALRTAPVARLRTVTVCYEHASAMRDDEQGSLEYIEKRLHQLNCLFPALKDEFTRDDLAPLVDATHPSMTVAATTTTTTTTAASAATTATTTTAATITATTTTVTTSAQ